MLPKSLIRRLLYLAIFHKLEHYYFCIYTGKNGLNVLRLTDDFSLNLAIQYINT